MANDCGLGVHTGKARSMARTSGASPAPARDGCPQLHLQPYCNEWAFRFNRRKSEHRGQLFLRLLENTQSRYAPTGTAFFAPLDLNHWSLVDG